MNSLLFEGLYMNNVDAIEYTMDKGPGRSAHR